MIKKIKSIFHSLNLTEVVLILLCIFVFFLPKFLPLGVLLLFITLIWNKPVIKKKTNWTAIAFISFYLLHLVYMLFTKNLAFGWLDLEMKLSFVLIPIYFLIAPGIPKEKFIAIFSKVAFFNAVCLIIIFLSKFLLFDVDILYYEDVFSAFLHRSYLSVYFSLAVAYFFNKLYKDQKPIYYLIILILSGSVILTFSKAGILLLCFVAILYLSLFLVKKVKVFIILTTILVGLSLGLNQYFPKPFKRVESIISLVFSRTKEKNNKISVKELEAKGKELDSHGNLKYPTLVDTTIKGSNDVRVAMWKTSMEVILDHPMGVGTGDVKDALKMYNTKKGNLELVRRNYNAHNQFLNTTVALGVLGGAVLLLIFIFSFFAVKETTILFRIVVVSIFLFALTEACFETQAGIIPFTIILIILGQREVLNIKEE